jgi:hypothetical protein
MVDSDKISPIVDSDKISPIVDSKVISSINIKDLNTGADLLITWIPFFGVIADIARNRAIGKRKPLQPDRSSFEYLGIKLSFKNSKPNLNSMNVPLLNCPSGNNFVQIQLDKIVVKISAFYSDRVTQVHNTGTHLCNKVNRISNNDNNKNGKGRPAHLCSFCNRSSDMSDFKYSTLNGFWKVDLSHFVFTSDLKHRSDRRFWIQASFWYESNNKFIQIGDSDDDLKNSWVLWQGITLWPHPSSIPVEFN